MNDSEFTPQEQELINRLANAPQPDLSPDIFDAIHARLLDRMDTLPVEASPRYPGRAAPMSVPLMTALAAVLVVAIGVTVLVLNRPQDLVTPTAIPTSVPTFTRVPPTATLSVESTVTFQTTPIPIQVTTPEATPETPVTPTLESVIMVEGPVQAINANVITIYGINIGLNPDDPLLSVLLIGDVLRVEANYDVTTGLIVAVTVEPVSNEVNVNPDTAEIWRDDGNCNNPPPPWAPANGWRRRCENPGNNSGGSNNGNGNGNDNGMGMGDDDD